MSGAIRILIADDHEVVRNGLRLVLEIEGGFVVVGVAADGHEAVRLAGELQPQVVLMDLRMPGMGGLEALQQIRTRWPLITVVILTTYNEDELMLQGLHAGAHGYLLKDTSREMLFDTLRAAARGQALLLPDVLARVMRAMPDRARQPAKTPRGEIALTEREREVLMQVAQGERSKEIAKRLNISERTVKAHLASIYNKLGVDSRAAAVTIAMQRGLL